MFGNFWESIWIVEFGSLKLRLPDLYDHEVVPLYHHKRLQTLLGVTLILLMENLCTTQGVRKCFFTKYFYIFVHPEWCRIFHQPIPKAKNMDRTK